MSPVRIIMLVGGFAAITALGGFVYTVLKWHGDSIQLERAKVDKTKAEEALQAERENFKKLAELRTKQIKEASNASKEVDDAYRRGTVPERVRKFYID